MHIVLQVITKLFVIITLISLGCARPQHFAETNQIVANDQEAAVNNNNMLGPGQLNDRELELIAQSIFQNQQPRPFSDWRDNLIRMPVQMKRQSKLACYFNPVSCFKK